MTKLRAGIVGLGVMGRHHLRILSNLDGVDLVGVFDPALVGSGELSGVPLHSSLQSLLQGGLDYCVLSAPTSFHLELGLQIAEHGVHTLIEKPVAVTADEAQQLVNAFSSRHLIGGVGHVERFNPAIQAMRQKISEGLLGEVFQVATRRQGPFPARISDVGVIKDLATHDIDLTMWTMQRQYTAISAHTAFRSGRKHEDMLVAIGQLEGGVIVSHLVNWLSPFKERSTTVIGEHGALVADTLTADLTYFENGTQASSWDGVSSFRGVSEGSILRFALVKTEPLLAEHQAFRDAVRSRDTSNIVTLLQGMHTVEVADRLLLS
jgi:UDP-N-acetylglucosamine 3-dehydrogenase